jgi:hypothetical protein
MSVDNPPIEINHHTGWLGIDRTEISRKLSFSMSSSIPHHCLYTKKGAIELLQHTDQFQNLNNTALGARQRNFY